MSKEDGGLIFKIGDKVWYASFERREKRIVCEDCYGDKYITVIMGDSSKVTIQCAGCQSGIEPSRGWNLIYEYEAKSQLTTINRIEIKKESIEYYTDYGCGENRVFATKEEADEKATELGRDYYAEQINRIKNLKEHNKRTWSWNAHYHRRQIKEAQRNLEYHTAKLNVAKIKAKEDEDLPIAERKN